MALLPGLRQRPLARVSARPARGGRALPAGVRELLELARGDVRPGRVARPRDALVQLCRQAFAEMRYAGITAVGEFHYLHHERRRRLGLRRGGAGGRRRSRHPASCCSRPTTPPAASGGRWSRAQRRFETSDLGRTGGRGTGSRGSWTRAPSRSASSPTASAPRSLAEIKALHAEAARRRLPFHMHVEEQRREIEETLAAYGRTPMRLLCEELETAADSRRCTAPTPSPEDMVAFLQRGGRRLRLPAHRSESGRRHPRSQPLLTRSAGGSRSGPTPTRGSRPSRRCGGWSTASAFGPSCAGPLTDGRGGVAATRWRRRPRGGAAALGIGSGPHRAGGVGRFRRHRPERSRRSPGEPSERPARRDRLRRRQRGRSRARSWEGSGAPTD